MKWYINLSPIAITDILKSQPGSKKPEFFLGQFCPAVINFGLSVCFLNKVQKFQSRLHWVGNGVGLVFSPEIMARLVFPLLLDFLICAKEGRASWMVLSGPLYQCLLFPLWDYSQQNGCTRQMQDTGGQGCARHCSQSELGCSWSGIKLWKPSALKDFRRLRMENSSFEWKLGN